MKRSLSTACGSAGRKRMTSKKSAATRSAAEQQLVGWPLPAAVVARIEWMRSRVARSRSPSRNVRSAMRSTPFRAPRSARGLAPRLSRDRAVHTSDVITVTNRRSPSCSRERRTQSRRSARSAPPQDSSREREPAEEEGDAANRGDGSEPALPSQGKQVEAAREDNRAGHEEPAGHRHHAAGPARM